LTAVLVLLSVAFVLALSGVGLIRAADRGDGGRLDVALLGVFLIFVAVMLLAVALLRLAAPHAAI
jgi:hypothetical protein